jgi:hypothetical protein
MNKNHPEIFSDAADLMLRRQQRIWLEIKVHLCSYHSIRQVEPPNISFFVDTATDLFVLFSTVFSAVV